MKTSQSRTHFGISIHFSPSTTNMGRGWDRLDQTKSRMGRHLQTIRVQSAVGRAPWPVSLPKLRPPNSRSVET